MTAFMAGLLVKEFYMLAREEGCWVAACLQMAREKRTVSGPRYSHKRNSRSLVEHHKKGNYSCRVEGGPLVV